MTPDPSAANTWFATARPVDRLEAEICFLIQPRFYFGPDRPAVPADLQRLTVSLSPPDVPRAVPSKVRTSEAVGHEAQLLAYYEQIVRLAREHRLPFNAIRHCFWLRFWLWNEAQDIRVSFPWYDSFSEIDRFMTAVSDGRSGLLDHDLDQGWEMEVHGDGDRLFIREGDPDGDEAHLAISVPRDALVQVLTALRARAVQVIGRLSDGLGADVWTSYVKGEPAFRVSPG